MIDRSFPRLIESATGIVFLCSLVSLAGFGLFTYRRLRKLPDVKQSLGWQPFPGFGIVSTALALAWPPSMAKMLSVSPLRKLIVDSEIVRRNTAAWEQFLGGFAFRCQVLCLLLDQVGSALRRWGAEDGIVIAVGVTALALLALGAAPSALSALEARRIRRIEKFGPTKLEAWWDGVLKSLE